jgi:hypothetical protein
MKLENRKFIKGKMSQKERKSKEAKLSSIAMKVIFFV